MLPSGAVCLVHTHTHAHSTQLITSFDRTTSRQQVAVLKIQIESLVVVFFFPVFSVLVVDLS